MTLSMVEVNKRSWSKSFLNGIVQRSVGFYYICLTISSQYIQLFYTHCTEQLNCWSMGGCNFGNILPVNVPNVTEGKFMFFHKQLSISMEFYYLEPDLYPSFIDFVEAMNDLNQQRQNHSESSITIKVSRISAIVDIYLVNEKSGLACFSQDRKLGHIFGSHLGRDFGVMLTAEGPHKPEFPYNFVSIHSLIIYTDLIEYNIVGDTKTLWLRCFSFISKPQAGH